MPKNTKKLKIALVVDDGLDRPDGVQQYVLTVGSWLESRGHSVRYLAGETKRKDKEGIYSLARNVQVQFNGNGLSIPMLASSSKINRIIKSEQFDVVHVQVPYSPFMAARVISRAEHRTAVVGTFHILPYGLLSNLGTRLLGFYLHRNLKRFDKHIAVSAPARAFAERTFGIEAVVIPNAVNIDLFRVQKQINKHSKTRIVFLGRLVKRKGCMELLKAVKHVRESGETNFELFIYGRGPEQAHLEQFVEANDMTNYVFFMGYATEEDKPKILSSADIAVFPSLAGESFGIVLIEAMAAGATVVVGGDNPGYSSVLKDEDTLFDPKNTLQFAGALTKYISGTSGYMAKIHESQQKIVQAYNIDVVGKQIEQAYYDCIKARNNKITTNDRK